MKRQQRLVRIGQLADSEITADERHAASLYCDRQSVALFIVAYNAERHLADVVRRIPGDLAVKFAEIIIIDDSSRDDTYRVATQAAAELPAAPVRVFRTPFNRGYGGNQKLGFLYCIDRGFNTVVLLHGDGQYAPEYLPRLLAACARGPDVVLASRMMRPRDALQGGMPLHKWAGNQILTALGNRLLGTRLSEFHTGYRAYSVAALQAVPFSANSDGFHFDGEIIAQGKLAGWTMAEVAIPTYYGDEVCHVPGVRYGGAFLKALLAARLTRLGIFYQPNFDVDLFADNVHALKRSPHSLHQYALRAIPDQKDLVTLELGANRGERSRELAKKVGTHVAVDRRPPESAGESIVYGLDLEQPFSHRLPEAPFDLAVALDVIEHMASPERFLAEVFRVLRPHSTLIASTANIAYLPMRLGLLAGQFNYGKRGVLDMTHKRLFTITSFLRLLRHSGFRVERVHGFPPPLTDMIGSGILMRWCEALHSLLSRWWPRMFAFNFAVIATRLDSVEDVFQRTVGEAEQGPRRVDGR